MAELKLEREGILKRRFKLNGAIRYAVCEKNTENRDLKPGEAFSIGEMVCRSFNYGVLLEFYNFLEEWTKIRKIAEKRVLIKREIRDLETEPLDENGGKDLIYLQERLEFELLVLAFQVKNQELLAFEEVEVENRKEKKNKDIKVIKNFLSFERQVREDIVRNWSEDLDNLFNFFSSPIPL